MDGVHDGVGPVLEAGEVAQAIILAIEKACGAVAIVDRGAYLRVSVPVRCTARRVDIEGFLGRPFRLPGDLEVVMPSFKGTLTIGAEEIVWAFRGKS